MKKLISPIWFCLFILLAAITVQAQVDTASLTGQVSDPNSAAISGARVVATNQATNISVETTSNDEGYYTFANLRPSLYTIEVSQQGFNKSSRKDIELNVGQKARIDFQLAVGEVSVNTVVTAESQPILQREDASLGNVVDNRRVTTLPLPQRSWDDLIVQVAGTQADPYTEQSGGTASGRTGAVNIHGVRSLYNNFILDGQDNNSISTNVQEFSTQVSRPSIDSLSELRVVTAPYSAETGRAAGGVVSVTTKSGTNEFHGVLYEYHRNRVFDANDFFANKFGREKPQRVQNQFGGNIGGPIWKNKAFFFTDYEGTRIRQGVLRVASVPLVGERNGNFSGIVGNPILVGGQQVQLLDANCQPTGQILRQGQIFNPTTTRVNTCRNVPNNPYSTFAVVRDLYPNNIISNIDPVSRRLAALFPNPTGLGRSSNFTRTPNLNDDGTRLTTRIDYKINGKHDIFGRHAWGQRNRFVPGFFGGLADGTDTSAWGLTDVTSHALVAGWNYVLTPNIVNQFRFGYNYANADSAQEPFNEGSSASYIRGLPDVGQGGIPAIVISGFTPRLGSADFLPKFQKSKQFQFTDTLSWVRGAHTLRFGTDIMAPLKLDYIDVPGTRGRFDFAANYTAFPNAAGTGIQSGTGNALADFLAGYPSNILLTNAAVINQRRYMYSFFGQDDWKVTPRLTVNLGLRYDFGSPAYEVNNRLANFDPAAAARATNQAEALASLRLATDGSLEERALIEPDRNNFSPRVGFAYSLTDKLVVRGGYGIFYNLVDRIGSEDQIALNPPNVINFNTGTNSPTSPVFGVTLNGGIPANLLNPNNIQIRNIQVRAANPESRTPYIQQGSIGVQYELFNGWLAEANYVATKGTKLYTLRDLNQRLPGQPDSTKPFQQFGLVEYRDDNGISNYHALETTLDKRFSNGYTIRAVYTLSRSKDNTGEHLTSGGGGAGSVPQNARDLSQWYSYSDFDVKHRIVINGIWELPFGKGRAYFNEGIGAAILGGWELAGSFNRRTGKPFTVNQNDASNILNLGSQSTVLPDLNGDPNLENRTVDRWFNTGAFSLLTPGTTRFGNQRRNQLRGPNFNALDLAIHRRFGLWNESTNLEFRWEVFNVLNTANFGFPNRNLTNTNIGTITQLSGDPRIMQFALRLNF